MKKPWKSNINAEKGYDSPLQLGDLESIRRGDKRLECAENFIPEYFVHKNIKQVKILTRQRKPEYLPKREDGLIPGSPEALERMRFLAVHNGNWLMM